MRPLFSVTGDIRTVVISTDHYYKFRESDLNLWYKYGTNCNSSILVLSWQQLHIYDYYLVS
jgi:hypothetical protein